jgi:hypothetical protein
MFINASKRHNCQPHCNVCNPHEQHATDQAGRSRDCMNGTSTVHWPAAQVLTVNPYGLRNGVVTKMLFNSSTDTSRFFMKIPLCLPCPDLYL